MESYEFVIQSKTSDIDFINKIVESYEGVGFIKTVDAKKGVISFIVTKDFRETAREIIEDLNRNHVKTEICEERLWDGVL
ncbi:MAG: DUF4911 domain-containing protein [Fusobacteriaceae bacterium]|jgi:hypothetical protein|nr:DUF4911 domain-containing protein [Fusobacteriaceae bacterium]